jgi:hypothetical protein
MCTIHIRSVHMRLVKNNIDKKGSQSRVNKIQELYEINDNRDLKIGMTNVSRRQNEKTLNF